MAKIMSRLSEGKYNVNLDKSGILDAATLANYGRSEDMYLAHIRIKKDGTGDGYHSEMVSNIEYTYDDNGNITGISKVHTANPWNGGNSFTGKTSYKPDEIARWDVFKVVSNPNYYKQFVRDSRSSDFRKLQYGTRDYLLH
jgi:hypothetical protein